MSFFQGVDTQQNEFEMSGGDDLPPIPKGTRVLASIEQAKNDSYENDRYINLMWRVHQPAEHANRVIYQKLKVFDEKTAQRHKQMLVAIDLNAGGKMMQSVQRNNEAEPSDMSLQLMANHPMVLLLDVWKIEKDRNGNPLPASDVKQGNWVKAVSPRAQGGQAATQPAPAPAPAPAAQAFDNFDESIPF